jgi:hypothetical protein
VGVGEMGDRVRTGLGVAVGVGVTGKRFLDGVGVAVAMGTVRILSPPPGDTCAAGVGVAVATGTLRILFRSGVALAAGLRTGKGDGDGRVRGAVSGELCGMTVLMVGERRPLASTVSCLPSRVI